jgi:hypothetical protein
VHGAEEKGESVASKKEKATQKGRKVHQIALRVPVEQHAELVGIAETLGVDVTSLVRLMIGRSIAYFREEAMVMELERRDTEMERQRWREKHPGRPWREWLYDGLPVYLVRKAEERLQKTLGIQGSGAEDAAARAAAGEHQEGQQERK